MSKVQSYLSFLRAKSSKPNYPLFIYLSGMDGTGQLLHTQADSLAKTFDICSLVIPADDLNNWESLTLSTLNLIEAELKKRSEHSIYLCGESFGACLALKVILKAPWLFERLILVNPASSFNQQPLLSWGVEITQWIPDFLHQGSTLGFLPFLAALGRIAPNNRRALLNAMRTLPQSTISWRLSLLREFEIDNYALSKLTQPVLVIASHSDRLLPSVEEANRLVEILPNVQMVVLPRSGHACLLETDVGLYEIMESQNFLADLKENVPLSR